MQNLCRFWKLGADFGSNGRLCRWQILLLQNTHREVQILHRIFADLWQILDADVQNTCTETAYVLCVRVYRIMQSPCEAADSVQV